MRHSLLMLIVFIHPASAQLTETEVKGTLKSIVALQDETTGGFKANPKSDPSLKATAAGLRIWKQLSKDKFPNLDKVTAFVLGCHDPISGGFHEPRCNPDVVTTCFGLMAAAEVGFPPKMYPRAMEYLKSNAKTFEDVRLGAAALESLDNKPNWLDDWIKIADAETGNDARTAASVAAMKLRLGYPVNNRQKVIDTILNDQRDDGGWGKAGASGSDLETTYRVIRALSLLKAKPKNPDSIRTYLKKCQKLDSGRLFFADNEPSIFSTYYAIMAIHFLKSDQ